MKNLSSLVKLVSKHKLKNLEIIGYDKNQSSLLSQLYNGIIEGEFTSDEKAAEVLYNSTASNKNYKKLKYQLGKRIINTLFFIDVNEAKFNTQERAFIQCNKNFAAVNILMGRGARANGVKLAERTINATLKYEYTALALEFSRLLFTHYSIHSPNRKKKNKYKILVEKLFATLKSEILAESYFADIRSEFALKKGAYSESLAIKAQKFSRELLENHANVNSKKFKFFSNALLLFSYQLNADHENVISFSKEAAEKFKKNLNRNASYSNYLRVIASLIALRKFEEAKWYFENEETYHNMGDRPWFITQELKFIFFLYTREYQNAFKVLIEVSEDANLANMSILTQETWMLNEAYIQLFIELELINPEHEKRRIAKFKMGKFLNTIPVAAKDKRGLNIQILILQVLFLLRRDKIDQVLNRMQVLNQYAGKYLKKDYTFRSNVFIKMLIVLIRNQMHREAVNRKAGKYLKMLREHPIEKSKQSIAVEVIPYEHLWELIIADTKNEFRFTPAKVKKIQAAFGTDRRGRKSSK